MAQKGEVVSGAWGRIEWVIRSYEMIAGTQGDTWLYTTNVDVGFDEHNLCADMIMT